MTEETKKYAEKRIIESGIRRVPGHYPEFKSVEHVDQWIDMSISTFEDYFKNEQDIESLIKIDLDEYRSLLDRLKKNKTNVSLELLNTKYQKSYIQLKSKLKMMTEDIFQNAVLTGLQIEWSRAEKEFLHINELVKKSGILKEASQAVFVHQDADQVIKLAGQLRIVIHQHIRKAEELYADKEK